MSAANELMIDARTHLVLEHPFFGTLALRLQLVEDESVDTAATDGRSLIYNPAFVAGLTGRERIFLWAHEVTHCASLHHLRLAGKNAEKFNVAADHAANLMLMEAGFSLIGGALADRQYEGMSAEEIYTRLPDDAGKQGKGGKGGGKGGDFGKVISPSGGVSPEESQQEWQVATQQAAKAAKAFGRLPGALEKLAGELVRPKVEWRALLRRFVQESARSDYSWRLPAARYVATGLYLPALRSETMPPIVVVIDTSGSCVDQAGAFLSEVESIQDEVKPETVWLMECDTKVARVRELAPGDTVERSIKGGGGTDFRPPFEEVERREIEPACLIYLTDGEGSFPKAAPGYPVLWVMVTNEVAPWGETVRMERT